MDERRRRRKRRVPNHYYILSPQAPRRRPTESHSRSKMGPAAEVGDFVGREQPMKWMDYSEIVTIQKVFPPSFNSFIGSRRQRLVID